MKKTLKLFAKILLFAVLVDIFYWLVILCLVFYANHQENEAFNYMQTNQGSNAITSLQRTLYITGGNGEGDYISYNIGDIYAFGISNVKQNHDNALYWYKHNPVSIMQIIGTESHSLNSNHIFDVAICFAGGNCSNIYKPSGYIIKQDVRNSVLWMKLASDLGNVKAKNIVQICNLQESVLYTNDTLRCIINNQ